MKKIILIFFLYFSFATILYGSYSGSIGLNRISKTIDSDRLELTREGFDVMNRIDAELNYDFNGYSLGMSIGLVEPESINEILLRVCKKKRESYLLGLEYNSSNITAGILLLGGKYFFIGGTPFLMKSELAIFKNSVGFTSGFTSYYFNSVDINIPLDVKIEDGQLDRMIGMDINYRIDKKSSVKTGVHYFTKNGIEIFLEPCYRMNKFFCIALESYIATRNNSGFGMSLIYAPNTVKGKIDKMPVRIVPERLAKEPEETVSRSEIERRTDEVPEDKVSEEKVTEVEDKESLKESEDMLSKIVNGPYKRGIELYCADKYEEAIDEWKKALKLLEDESLGDFEEVEGYRKKCERNIENARQKIKIMEEE